MNEYTHTESEREREHNGHHICYFNDFMMMMMMFSSLKCDEEKKNSGQECDVAVVGWLVGLP